MFNFIFAKIRFFSYHFTIFSISARYNNVQLVCAAPGGAPWFHYACGAPLLYALCGGTDTSACTGLCFMIFIVS